MIDIEKLVRAHLRTQVDERVVGRTPGDTSLPWITLTLLDAPQHPATRPDHIVGYLLQLDCYAGAEGGQPEAVMLGMATRAAVLTLPAGDHADGVVTRARINGHARIPDSDFEPSRERIVITATVDAHPA